jgi:hypothetical protein
MYRFPGANSPWADAGSHHVYVIDMFVAQSHHIGCSCLTGLGLPELLHLPAAATADEYLQAWECQSSQFTC